MAQSIRYLAAPTFTQWLQAMPAGPWSPYATFALADRCWPRRSRMLLAFVRHVREVHDDDPYAPAERTVRAMFVAFERDVHAGRRLPDPRYGERMAAGLRRPTKSYSLAPATDPRIRAIQARLGLESRGAVIDLLVARYIDEAS